MTLRLRRKHQITQPNPRQAIQLSSRKTAGAILRNAAFALAIAGSVLLSDSTDAQEYQRGNFQPKRFNVPATALQNSGHVPAIVGQSHTESSLIRFRGQATASQQTGSSQIDVPTNPLRQQSPKSSVSNRIEYRDNQSAQSGSVSHSVEDILGAGRISRQNESSLHEPRRHDPRVRQASAVEITDLEFEGGEFDFDTGEPEIEIVDIEQGDFEQGDFEQGDIQQNGNQQDGNWQERRHVKQNTTPYPLQLNAARDVQQNSAEPAKIKREKQARPIEPKDDPFGDSARSVLKERDQTRSISYPNRRFQQDDEEIDLGNPKRDESTDRGDADIDDADRDELPAKRDGDRRFETNCDDVAAEVATRNVSLITLGMQPLMQGDDSLPLECPMAQVGNPIRSWECQTFTFTASALCHKPLYFEDIQLERYGHSAGPFVQPFKSAAHFFVRGVLLPYQMGIHPPNECVYALGYYRPGDCAPWLRDPFPISRRGLLYEAGFATGAAFLIP